MLFFCMVNNDTISISHPCFEQPVVINVSSLIFWYFATQGIYAPHEQHLQCVTCEINNMESSSSPVITTVSCRSILLKLQKKDSI